MPTTKIPSRSLTKAHAHVNSLAEYLEYLTQDHPEGRLLFRGQREDWPLLPKVARLQPRGDRGIVENERDLLDHFKRVAVALLPSVLPEPDKWDWLSIAQHHGLPTRLLDWTGNALMGLWFAVREVPARAAGPGVVWLLPLLPEDETDIDRTQDPMAGGRTHVFAPRHVAPRIRSQDGMFTCHKYVEAKGRFLPLETIKYFKARLTKLEVSARAFPTIRSNLNRLGLNAATSFPDLDGLSKHLEWLYARADDERV